MFRKSALHMRKANGTLVWRETAADSTVTMRRAMKKHPQLHSDSPKTPPSVMYLRLLRTILSLNLDPFYLLLLLRYHNCFTSEAACLLLLRP
jgi:hypothetical protein